MKMTLSLREFRLRRRDLLQYSKYCNKSLLFNYAVLP